MIPIGGRIAKNTMNEEEALEAVGPMSPKLVIPCHYNGAFLWKRNANPADAQYFKTRVERMGIECKIMSYGDEFCIVASYWGRLQPGAYGSSSSSPSTSSTRGKAPSSL